MSLILLKIYLKKTTTLYCSPNNLDCFTPHCRFSRYQVNNKWTLRHLIFDIIIINIYGNLSSEYLRSINVVFVNKLIQCNTFGYDKRSYVDIIVKALGTYCSMCACLFLKVSRIKFSFRYHGRLQNNMFTTIAGCF